MTTVLTTRAFNQKWAAEFEKCSATKRGTTVADDFWDGVLACKELKQKRCLPENFGPPLLVYYGRLFREIETYKRFASMVARYNQEFKETKEFLKDAESRALKKRDSLKLASLRGDLAELARSLADKQRQLEQRFENYWSDALLASAEERENWLIDLDTLQQTPPDDLLHQESLFSRTHYPKNLRRRTDLDARFQIRVGIIVRGSFPFTKITLRTVSRLVVLCYICAELAEDAPRLVET